MSVHTMETLSLFNSEPYRRDFGARVIAVVDQAVVLEHTLFYPTGGGQPGDTGYFSLVDGTRIAVTGTVRDPLLPSIIWHQVQECPPQLCTGALLNASLDWQRRYQHMKMHTCLHLLGALIDAPVTGCSISVDKGRLDFDLPEMTLDKDSITRDLNTLIERACPINVMTMQASEYSDLPKKTARPPVFQDELRVVEISGVDIQPCGGTHVHNTREIGRVYCEKIEKKSRTNRRVILRFEQA
ncbi:MULTISPECIES: alanyl-tRNA editing protein [unclassified Pseudomonas]|jgi:Ser-tRNA(Ala) deacylase AlaX|uniref:alanyl-tRNA editing protein n=1 Tax=unclassified Pseudomonas TaxID=196821 RepID=UPI000C832DE5|nr:MULTISPECIES: alanyl-tRNA editing protein [unclassified Pseudomonas]MDX9673752.1 alanyl-tRNA editing protein [Pseudomonas sp. P8_250]PMQ09109.1 Alanine--tRNA ligase [Pseudomonas sp. AD21]WPN37721.1 alanyl-tRNA editing protein [Pseudomonas sp. P8_139]WPN40476.1 alanyl-tRNA editing protein [Pseudomonas sp. P8_229]